MFGDGNFQLNSGEMVSLTLPILNFGSEDAIRLNIELNSENVNVNIENSIIENYSIASDSSEEIIFFIEFSYQFVIYKSYNYTYQRTYKYLYK